MEKIMGEFSSFLKETEGNEDMKSALDQVVKDIVSKDSLYEPMRNLREEFPLWLEHNWSKISQQDLDRYNAQLDVITEICKIYEENGENEVVFEKLSKLQEYGQPPPDLMKKLADQQFGTNNPFKNL
mmetsp:Transcript_27969/g.20945  ORF Transcript_27969/g.20945 Transcript_27969/m.20945 type:complete len:127 (-) Transcript_27969:30-410(-)